MGFFAARAPISEYEKRCRTQSFVADGHRIEFCERMESFQDTNEDILRDEGGKPWTPEFLRSDTFRSALQFHATNSTNSEVYQLGQIMELSIISAAYRSLGRGFYTVHYTYQH
ncbi:hypothetical protein BMW22_06820 [Rhizobium leguminosarum]|nr:hypothetical protein BMW22_06820 [Rhizobium leguminosarum]KZB00410.1 hypothetical protein A4A59_18610 [Rhizobium leguminosarum]